MRTPPIVSPQAWQAGRERLLVKEKAHMRAHDALAAERRRMPWMAVEKAYAFEGPTGTVSLLDLFEGLLPACGVLCGQFTACKARRTHKSTCLRKAQSPAAQTARLSRGFRLSRTSLLFPRKSDFWAQRQTGQMGPRAKSAQSQRFNARAERPQNAGYLALPQENLRGAGVIGGAMRTRTKDPDGFIDGARRDRCANVAEAVRECRTVDTNTAYIERGSPWETATSRASTRVFATNSSTARYSTRHAKRKPSSRVGGVTTTVSGRTRPRCSCPRSPRGRLRYVKRLRRPRFMARKSNAQANVKDLTEGSYILHSRELVGSSVGACMAETKHDEQPTFYVHVRNALCSMQPRNHCTP